MNKRIRKGVGGVNSVGGVALQRVGFIKARQALTFVAAWWITTAAIGHEPTVEEYAEWWAMSRATAFREQATYRAAFPEFAGPNELATAIGFDISTLKKRDAKSVPMQLFSVAWP